MTIKKRYQKAGFKFDVSERVGEIDYKRYTCFVVTIGEFHEFNIEEDFDTEAEAWQWVEKNFPLPEPEKYKGDLLPTNDAELKEFERIHGTDQIPLPDHLKNPSFLFVNIEAIKKKWQKRLKPIESNTITATAQQIETNKRQQEIGEQRIITEILSDLGEK